LSSDLVSTFLQDVRDGELEKVRNLLRDHPSLVFSVDENGATPLFLAALTGRKYMAELLIANKADLNTKNKNGHTPLDVAVEANHPDIVELLQQQTSVQNAAKPLANTITIVSSSEETQTHTNVSPLETLPSELVSIFLQDVRDGELKKVRNLIKEHPRLVFSVDENGATPLLLSALTGHKNMAELLLANKADPSTKNKYGLTPLDVAVAENHPDIVELLRQHGSQ